MDDSGHHENGRHKPPQGQWFLQHQPSMKQIMAIMAERDAAIQETNLALSEKRASLAERDMAVLQRDLAITERNTAIMERDNAIATLQYRENSMNSGNMSPCPPGCQIACELKHMHHPQQHVHHQPQLGEPTFNHSDMHMNESSIQSPAALEPTKSRRNKRSKEAKLVTSSKKTSKPSKKVKKEGEDLNKTMLDESNGVEWRPGDGWWK